MGVCGYCGLDVNARPYSGKRDLPSVTAVSDSFDDGKARSFGWAASLIATTTAVHEPEKWSGLGTDDCTHDIHVDPGLCPACKFIRSEFDRVWAAKGALGNHIHHLAQSWAEGDEIEVDTTCEPYMDAVEAFFNDCQPVWVELERTVLYDTPKSSGYRGTFDFIAKIDCPVCKPGSRCTWLGDWKSGRYSPASQTLQLSAYRGAQHLTRWEGKVENIEGPIPKVAHAGVVLLGADGRYTLQELPAGGDAFSTFLRLRACWDWHRTMRKWEKDNPLATPEGLKTDNDNQGEAAA